MEKSKMVLERFREKVVMTVEELTCLRDWSTVTVRRRLKKWGAHTSYNHNGRYYVLPDVPRFDHHGLWTYEGIRFSKHGTLTRSAVQLVESSEAGMSASELSNLLGYEMHPVLSRLTGSGALRRERYSGRNIYYSTRPRKFTAQNKARGARGPVAADVLSGEAAIMLLVEKIKSPDADVRELAAHVRNLGIRVEVEAASEFLRRYGLQKKT